MPNNNRNIGYLVAALLGLASLKFLSEPTHYKHGTREVYHGDNLSRVICENHTPGPKAIVVGPVVVPYDHVMNETCPGYSKLPQEQRRKPKDFLDDVVNYFQ